MNHHNQILMKEPIVGEYQEYICDEREPPSNAAYNKYIKSQVENRNRVKAELGFYLHMGNGDVDREEFPIPQCLTEVLIRSLQSQYYRYSHPLGRPTTRDLISEYENFIAGKERYTRKNIGTVLSATGGFASTMEILMNHNHFEGEGLITQPAFPVYEAVMWQRFGIKKIVGSEKDGFLPTPEQIEENIDDNTKFAILTSPSFPFGKAYPMEDLEKIVEISNKTKTYMILDEIFYDLPFVDIPNIGSVDDEQEFIIRVKGFSKDRSVPGFRVGYVIAAPSVMNELNRYANHNYGLPPSLFEPFIEKEMIMRMLMKGKTNVDFLNNHDLPEVAEKKYRIIGDCKSDLPVYSRNIQRTLDQYQRNRDEIIKKIEAIPKMSAGVVPDAGFNMGVRIEHQGSTFDFFRELFEKTGVVLAPGELFDMPRECGNWYRLTFANNLPKMEEALDRVGAYLGKRKMI